MIHPCLAIALDATLEDGPTLVLPIGTAPLFRYGAQTFTDADDPERQHRICGILRQLAQEIDHPVIVLDHEGGEQLRIDPHQPPPLALPPLALVEDRSPAQLQADGDWHPITTAPLSVNAIRKVLPPDVYKTCAPGTDYCPRCKGWHEPPICGEASQ